jgi:tripartite-type tricarboxylate transporter receptor subunit TctC
MPHTISRRTLGAAATLLAAPAIARAQARFPDRPIRMIVPWGAGGTTDIQMRALCDIAQRHLGQPIVIENRTGAAGTIGPAQLVRAPADGYLLSQMAISVFRYPYMVSQPPFNPETDFTWVIHLTGYTFGVVVRADSPFKEWKDVVAFARANPGRFTYGTPGVGTSLHITMEQIAGVENVEFTQVPFRGVADNLTNLLAGNIMATADSSGWSEMVRDNRVRLLCTWGPARAKRFPEAPTLRELGYDIVSTSPYGIGGPAGIDAAIVRTLHDAFEKALKDPAHVAVLDRFDQPVIHLDPAGYAAFARELIVKERAMVQRLGLRV